MAVTTRSGKGSPLTHAEMDANLSGLDTAVASKLAASAVSNFGLTLIDDADQAAARTTLGLGSAATQPSSAFATALTSTNSISATRDLAAGDAGPAKSLLCTWSTDTDITIPSGLAVGGVWTIFQMGIGRVRPVTKSGAGQTINALSGALYTPGQYGSIVLWQYAANSWLVLGGVP